MKVLLTLLTVFSIITVSAQTTEVINTSLSEDVKILYRGFANEIKIISKDERARPSCSNCMLTRNGDYYIVKPGRGKIAFINIVIDDQGNSDTLKIEQFNIMNLPDPSIYINGELSQGTLSEDLKFARVQYKPEVPLESDFTVTGWQLLIDGELFFGKNDRFPQMVNDAIAELKIGSNISLKLDVKGPDGITRRIGTNLTKE
jgi:hypothetical protein